MVASVAANQMVVRQAKLLRAMLRTMIRCNFDAVMDKYTELEPRIHLQEAVRRELVTYDEYARHCFEELVED